MVKNKLLLTTICCTFAFLVCALVLTPSAYAATLDDVGQLYLADTVVSEPTVEPSEEPSEETATFTDSFTDVFNGIIDWLVSALGSVQGVFGTYTKYIPVGDNGELSFTNSFIFEGPCTLDLEDSYTSPDGTTYYSFEGTFDNLPYSLSFNFLLESYYELSTSSDIISYDFESSYTYIADDLSHTLTFELYEHSDTSFICAYVDDIGKPYLLFGYLLNPDGTFVEGGYNLYFLPESANGTSASISYGNVLSRGEFSLTFLGTLAVIGVAIALTFLIIGVVRRFVMLRR